MARKCTKQRHRSRAAAEAAASQVLKGIPVRRRTYRCDKCRFSDGQRAWHWTNWTSLRRPRN